MIDYVNGTFELLGGLFIWLNVWRIYRDKMVRGVDWRTTLFFTVWGFWNMVYYPSLDQWMSFYGGLVVVIANCVWIGLTLYYRRQHDAD